MNQKTSCRVKKTQKWSSPIKLHKMRSIWSPLSLSLCNRQASLFLTVKIQIVSWKSSVNSLPSTDRLTSLSVLVERRDRRALMACERYKPRLKSRAVRCRNKEKCWKPNLHPVRVDVRVFIQRAKFRASFQCNEVFPKGGAGMHASTPW